MDEAILKKRIGDNMREARCLRGLTPWQMAFRLGIHLQDYEKVENGFEFPELLHLLAFCRIVGQTPSQILGF